MLDDTFRHVAKIGMQPRRVASAAGALFYGVPIGTVITSDMKLKARAKLRGLDKPRPKPPASNFW